MKDRQSVRSEGLVASPRVVSRIPIFAPTRRPMGVQDWKVETPWGWAVITGRLGQQHRDLLDAARMIAEAEQWTADGRLHLKLDPARLRSALGGDSVNNQRIKEWIEDLRRAKVELHVGDRVIIGGIVSEYELSADATVLHPRPGALGSGERHYMRMSFSTGWSKLIESEQAMRYPLAAVVSLQHGFSQAVARFCLSHKQVRDTVASLMTKVGAGGNIRERRRDIRDDAAALRELGIEIDGDAIRKLPSVGQSPVGVGQSPVGVGQSPVKTPSYQIYQIYQGVGAGAESPTPDQSQKQRKPNKVKNSKNTHPLGGERKAEHHEQHEHQ